MGGGTVGVLMIAALSMVAVTVNIVTVLGAVRLLCSTHDTWEGRVGALLLGSSAVLNTVLICMVKS